MNRSIIFGVIALLIVGAGWLFLKEDGKTASGLTHETRIVKNGAGPGQDVTIPVKPKRVIVLTASALEMWIGAGGQDTLVGRPQTMALPKELLASLDKAGVVDVGTPNGVSLEKIMGQKPDLVIGLNFAFHQQLAEPLKQAGIPILLVTNNSVEDNIKQLTLFGELTGKPEIAKKQVDRIQGNIAAEAKRREGKAPVKALIIWGTPESFSMALPQSLPGDLLRLAGGVNVSEGQVSSAGMAGGMSYAPFSLEFGLQANPDRILFVTHGKQEEVEASMKKTLASNAAWQAIPAVREGRFSVLPYELFAINPGLRSDEAVVYLSKALYPEGQ